MSHQDDDSLSRFAARRRFMVRRWTSAVRWLLLGLLGTVLVPLTSRADDLAVTRLVPADAAIYVEVVRPDGLIDRLTAEKFQEVVGAIPGYSKAVKDGQLTQLRAAVEFVAG